MAYREMLLAAACALALVLTGCGVKGPLEAPPSANTAAGGEIIDGDTTKETPRRRIVLDGLLE